MKKIKVIYANMVVLLFGGIDFALIAIAVALLKKLDVTKIVNDNYVTCTYKVGEIVNMDKYLSSYPVEFYDHQRNKRGKLISVKARFTDK